MVEIANQPDDYIVEGYIDLSPMQTGDAVEIREYIAVDGVNYRLYARVIYNDVPTEPIVRLHAKTFPQPVNYKVTVIQTKGTPRTFPYAFLLEVLGVI